MSAATDPVLAFDPLTAIREAQAENAKRTPADREEARRNFEKLRLDACEYALASDDPELRELAARFLTRPAA